MMGAQARRRGVAAALSAAAAASAGVVLTGPTGTAAAASDPRPVALFTAKYICSDQTAPRAARCPDAAPSRRVRRLHLRLRACLLAS
jgi:hypothetical protein